jgi:hypothetical protein
MTTTRVESVACAVCATRSVHTTLASSDVFGAYDLDLRPPPLLRHTLNLWLQECPSCHYVHERIDQRLPQANAIVYSPEYAAIASLTDEPPLVRRFKRHALLMAEHPISAAQALLHAAWVCDDEGCAELAAASRDECADLLIGVNFAELSVSERFRWQTVLVDVLRRVGRFDEALGWIERLLVDPALPVTLTPVLRAQQQRVAVGDVVRHTLN